MCRSPSSLEIIHWCWLQIRVLTSNSSPLGRGEWISVCVCISCLPRFQRRNWAIRVEWTARNSKTKKKILKKSQSVYVIEHICPAFVQLVETHILHTLFVILENNFVFFFKNWQIFKKKLKISVRTLTTFVNWCFWEITSTAILKTSTYSETRTINGTFGAIFIFCVTHFHR
jgi:hypothetical protein